MGLEAYTIWKATFNKNNIKSQTHNQVHFRKKEAITRNLENLGDFLRVLLPEMLIQKISSHYLAASSQSKHGWPLPVSSVSPTSERLFIFLWRNCQKYYMIVFSVSWLLQEFELRRWANYLNWEHWPSTFLQNFMSILPTVRKMIGKPSWPDS